jgi:Ino eighty subunit 2
MNLLCVDNVRREQHQPGLVTAETVRSEPIFCTHTHTGIAIESDADEAVEDERQHLDVEEDVEMKDSDSEEDGGEDNDDDGDEEGEEEGEEEEEEEEEEMEEEEQVDPSPPAPPPEQPRLKIKLRLPTHPSSASNAASTPARTPAPDDLSRPPSRNRGEYIFDLMSFSISRPADPDVESEEDAEGMHSRSTPSNSVAGTSSRPMTTRQAVLASVVDPTHVSLCELLMPFNS